MPPPPKQLLSFVVAAALAVTNAVGDENGNSTQSEQLALVRSWLPSYHKSLQLVFEYTASNEKHQQFDSKTLHNRIDKVGPTVVIIQAQNAYEDEPRIIGGYNPYKWKNWLGFYERDPGLFIFDLSNGKKWERKPQKPRWVKRSPKRYGLSFGEGDLVLSPDLKTGTANNNSFAPASSAKSNLIGQAGSFLVESIKVYQVKFEEGYGPMADPTFVREWQPSPAPPPQSRYSVPDAAFPFIEAIIAFVVLAVFRYKLR